MLTSIGIKAILPRVQGIGVSASVGNCGSGSATDAIYAGLCNDNGVLTTIAIVSVFSAPKVRSMLNRHWM